MTAGQIRCEVELRVASIQLQWRLFINDQSYCVLSIKATADHTTYLPHLQGIQKMKRKNGYSFSYVTGWRTGQTVTYKA